MITDHTVGTHSKDILMREARKQLVAAMTNGTAFYVQLTRGSWAQFTGAGAAGGCYCEDDSLPLSMLDHKVVSELAPYRGREKGVLDLYTSSTHSWAKVLREPDLDRETGTFHVHADFEVVVCINLEKEEEITELMGSLPAGKMQVIQLVDGFA
jgi:hypothetical protein